MMSERVHRLSLTPLKFFYEFWTAEPDELSVGVGVIYIYIYLFFFFVEPFMYFKCKNDCLCY